MRPVVAILFVLSCGFGPQGTLLAQDPDVPLTIQQYRRLLTRDLHEADSKRFKAEGKLAEAIKAAEAVVAIDREVLGDHKNVVQDWNYLASLQMEAKDFAASAKSWQQLVAVETKVLGPDHTEVMNSRRAAATMAYMAKLSPKQRSEFDQAQVDVARGATLIGIGQKDDGDAAMRKGMSALRELTRGDPLLLGLVESMAGVILAGTGSFDLALAPLRDGDVLMRKHFGDRYVLSNEGVTLDYQLVTRWLQTAWQQTGRQAALAGDWKVALRQAQDSLDWAQDRFGKDSDQAVDARLQKQYLLQLQKLSPNDLRDLVKSDQWLDSLDELNKADKYAQAEALAAKVIELRMRLIGKDHPTGGLAWHWQANMVQRQNRAEESLKLFRLAIARYEDAKGVRHADSVEVRNQAADHLDAFVRTTRQKGELAAARTLAGELLELRRKNHPADHWKVQDALRHVAILERLAKHTPNDQKWLLGLSDIRDEIADLVLRGNYKAASTLLQKALARVNEIEPKAPGLFVPSLLDLPLVTRLPANRVGIEPLLRLEVQWCQRAYGPTHPRTAGANRNLGNHLRLTGVFTQAKQLLESALAVVKDTEGTNQWTYWYLHAELGFLYQSRGLLVQAEHHHRLAMNGIRDLGGASSPDYAQAVLNLGVLYRLRGEHDRSIPLMRELVELRKKSFGTKHFQYGNALNSLAFAYLTSRDFDRAEPLLKEALEIVAAKQGKQSPIYGSILLNLADVERFQGRNIKADEWLQRGLEQRKQALGAKSLAYANVLDGLGHYYASGGGFRVITALENKDTATRATRLLVQAYELRRELLDPDHPEIAASLHHFGVVHRLQGDYAKAENFFLQALDIRQRKLPALHGDTANTLNSLAVTCQQAGDLMRAEEFGRQSVAQFSKLFGPEHSQVALSTGALASIYASMGDYSEAEKMYRRVLSINKKTLGERHANYAAMLSRLGQHYVLTRELDQAELFLQHAARLQREMFGDKSTIYARALQGLANVSLINQQVAQAESLARQALRIHESAGSGPEDVAIALLGLSRVLQAQGKLDEAEKTLHRVVAVQEALFVANHPRTAETYSWQGMLAHRRGDAKAAVQHTKKSLDISLANLRVTAGAQSERQQLQMAQTLRRRLDHYLSTALDAGRSTEETYGYLLAWKGAVFARQQQARLLRREADPKIAALQTSLISTSSELANMAFATPEPAQQDAWRKRFQELSDDRERLEAELARSSAGYRNLQDQAKRTAKDILKALPKDTILVDFLEYTKTAAPPGGKGPMITESHLAAFILAAGQPVRRVELGPTAPIAKAIDDWRSNIARRQPKDAGADLRKFVWVPLTEALGSARTVLISPDGVVARLPFGALPGAKAGTFLIEDVSLAVLPVPQLLPELIRAERASAEPALCLIGDVDFGADPVPGTPKAIAPLAARAGSLGDWQTLPGTRDEVLTLRDAFTKRYPKGKISLLQAGDATEAAVRAAAARHQWLHFATHGFFAPPSLQAGKASGSDLVREELVGFHPGLLSGLVLAGANHAPKPGRDDNILTALEVAELDLAGVSLAVLSACETGLGKVAGGEGILGLQRAFQVSGTQTVVSSLWSVPDQPTRVLMERFYDNMLSKKMGRLEALRDAQIWMLREGRTHAGVQRGIQRLEKNDEPITPGRLPPYYWAAFVLSGDWR